MAGAVRITGNGYEGYDLTTVAAVKAFLSVTTTVEDAWLAAAVSRVSRAAIEFLGRHALRTARVEEYQLRRSMHVLSLDGYVVDETQPFEVAHSSTRVYASDLAASYYVLNPRIGTVRLITDLPEWKSYVRVTYTGGMAADTATFMAAFPDVSDAVLQQVVYLRSRRDALGGSLEMRDGVKAVQQGEYGWLAESRRVLNLHRRVAL